MPTLAGNCSGSGTSPSWLSSGINNNAWFQWYWMSNELRSPKVLACPSDAQKRPARDWSFAADGGFLHANYRNGALSYLLGLDVLPENRLGLLAGDRNVRFNLFGQSCSSGIAPVFGLNLNLVPGSFGIGNGLHVESGNYLFTDGRVEELSSQGFVKRLQAVYGVQDNGAVHFLTP